MDLNPHTTTSQKAPLTQAETGEPRSRRTNLDLTEAARRLIAGRGFNHASVGRG